MLVFGWGWGGGWMGVGRPYPPVRNDIVTPLLDEDSFVPLRQRTNCTTYQQDLDYPPISRNSRDHLPLLHAIMFSTTDKIVYLPFFFRFINLAKLRHIGKRVT